MRKVYIIHVIVCYARRALITLSVNHQVGTYRHMARALEDMRKGL